MTICTIIGVPSWAFPNNKYSIFKPLSRQSNGAVKLNTETSKQGSIQLQSKTSECDQLYKFIEQFLGDPVFNGMVDNEIISDLKLSAEELFANIVHHGYQDDPSMTIQVELATVNDGISLTMRDSAPAFNPFEEATIDLDHDLSEGGMGMTFVISMTDEQEYSYENGYNVIRLIKHYNSTGS